MSTIIAQIERMRMALSRTPKFKLIHYPLEQGLADPAVPILLEYEKILQVELRITAPGRIGTKKKREAERIAFTLRNQAFEGWVAIFYLCANAFRLKSPKGAFEGSSQERL
jgi:hypothetical protein